MILNLEQEKQKLLNILDIDNNHVDKQGTENLIEEKIKDKQKMLKKLEEERRKEEKRKLFSIKKEEMRSERLKREEEFQEKQIIKNENKFFHRDIINNRRRERQKNQSANTSRLERERFLQLRQQRIEERKKMHNSFKR